MGASVAFAAASTAVSAGSAIMQSQAQADALEAQGQARQARAEFQAEQTRAQAEISEDRAEESLRNAQVAEIQARQRVAARQEQLQRTLASQTAAAAGAGIAIGPGGSLSAIQRETRERARRDITSVRFLGANQERRSRIQARNRQQTAENQRESARQRVAFGQTANQLAQQRASTQRIGGFLQAGSTLLSAGSRFSQAGGSPDFQSPSEFSGIQRPAPGIRSEL